MKRILLVIAILVAAAYVSPGWSAVGLQNKSSDMNDQEALKQLVKEWADAAVHGDLQKLDRFADDNFRGSAEGISFDKKKLVAAIRSGQMKVASWDCDDIKVNVRGSAGVVTGRCMLSNATFMGKDFSGSWEFTDRFVKQRDGGWRAVSSQSKRIRQ